MDILVLIFCYITIVSVLNILIWLINNLFDIYNILKYRNVKFISIISLFTGYRLYHQISDSILLFKFNKNNKPLYKIGQTVWISQFNHNGCYSYVRGIQIKDIAYRANNFYYTFVDNQSRHEDIISPIKLEPNMFTKEHIKVINKRLEFKQWIS